MFKQEKELPGRARKLCYVIMFGDRNFNNHSPIFLVDSSKYIELVKVLKREKPG